MTNQNRPAFNTVPHYIAEDYRGGRLNINQLRVLLWLRTIGTPYGITTTSLDDLTHDVFPDLDLKINTINSILLKLRQKRHIFFEPRQGKAGTFDIKLNHWLMPNKGYQTLDKYFLTSGRQDTPQGKELDTTIYPQAKSSEDHQKIIEQNQKLIEAKRSLISKYSGISETRQIRSYHNEHDTKTKIENYDNTSSTFKGTLKRVNDFQPNSHEEDECKRIALEIRDEYINPILSVLRTDGFARIEQAWGIFREHRKEGKQMDDPAKYFQGIINILRKQNGEH